MAAAIPNCNYLELQYGEVDWRRDVLVPAEHFPAGTILVPDTPGFGISLNDEVIRENELPI